MWVGIRWERFVLRVRWRLVGRACESIRVWWALGAPEHLFPHRAYRRLFLVQFVRFLLGCALVGLGPWLLGILFQLVCQLF
jgi:hypothetical protein